MKKSKQKNKLSEDVGKINMSGWSNAAQKIALSSSPSMFSQQNKRGGKPKSEDITYQNPLLLKLFLTDPSRKYIPSKYSKLSRKIQSLIREHVARCRFLALLPYIK